MPEYSPEAAQVYAKQQLALVNEGGFTSLIQIFQKVVAEKADLVAYSCMGKELTFADIDLFSGQVAAYLSNKCDLKKGDRIAIQLPNILQYPVIAWGALRAGLVIVNTNPMYTKREMLHQFTDAGVKALVILSDSFKKAEGILHQTKIETVITTSAMDFLKPQAVPKSKFKNVVGFMDMLSKGKKLKLPNPSVTMDDIALLQYTGGTTGVAKGAVLTHGNIYGGLKITRDFFADVAVDREVIIAPMPLYHVYGFTMNVVSVFLWAGMSVLIPNARDITSIVHEMKAYKATGLAGVNTLFQAMMEHAEFNEIDFSNLTGTIAGGTALIKEIADEWKQRTGSDIYEGYGLSETGAALTCNIEGKRKLGTVGLPFKNMEVKLIDGAGAKAAKGESGELCLRGPQVMVGYWNRLAATAEVIDSDGWFKTGDVAEIDDEGFIKIVDRIKDMVLVSGFNVYPTEIENVVYGHTDIVECAVVGVPDAKTGEAVKLYVNSSNPNLTAEALREFCKRELTAYKVPKNIEFLDELPKSPVGKILRRELRA
jgi:long-chain acyl-CoA synthetase